ncbi:MAG: SIS domain-containing protein [Armatimonadota bacterium]|nr:SIS domain-containing protein [Armatimonadota bacterium]
MGTIKMNGSNEKVSIIQNYVKLLKEALQALSEEALLEIADILRRAHQEGKQVFLLGNGGSAANATHIAEDLQKGVKEHTGRRFKVLSLADSTPLITAWANDTSYEQIFVEQIESLVEPGDVVIAISGSGNSPNVLRAVEKANEMGAVTIGLTGFDGGKLAKTAQKSVVVASDNMQRVEDVHLVIGHILYTYLVNI